MKIRGFKIRPLRFMKLSQQDGKKGELKVKNRYSDSVLLSINCFSSFLHHL